jgi:hypothetical protein
VAVQHPLHILCNKVTTDDGKPGLRVRLRCDDMDLAADLVQDMARCCAVLCCIVLSVLLSRTFFIFQLTGARQFMIFFRYFKISELEAEADFPDEILKFEEVPLPALSCRLYIAVTPFPPFPDNLYYILSPFPRDVIALPSMQCNTSFLYIYSGSTLLLSPLAVFDSVPLSDHPTSDLCRTCRPS